MCQMEMIEVLYASERAPDAFFSCEYVNIKLVSGWLFFLCIILDMYYVFTCGKYLDMPGAVLSSVHCRHTVIRNVTISTEKKRR